jgi:hypothetical protein
MGGLYSVTYEGVAGRGHAVLYIGNGAVLGGGVDDNRYHGAYAVHGGNLVGQAVLIAREPTTLITGHRLVAGQQVPINFTLPPDFSNGAYHPLIVAGAIVRAAFEKIGDIP